MKSKKILILLLVVVLFVGGYILLRGQSTENPDNNAMNEPAEEEMTEENVDMTMGKNSKLFDLLALGIPQRCSYEDLGGEYEASGTTYIGNGMIRGDYVTRINEQTQSGHTIYDGTKSYVWLDGSQTGFVLDVGQTAEEVGVPKEAQMGLNMEKEIDYSCVAWEIDETKFVPPGDVEFTIYAIPTSGRVQVRTENDPCELCDTLSGEQKTQCLETLKCN